MKYNSIIMTLVIIFCACFPVSAVNYKQIAKTAEMSPEQLVDQYAFRGADIEQLRFNMLINYSDNTGQFAIVFKNMPQYVFEFLFCIDDVFEQIKNEDLWESIRLYCLMNENRWRKIDIISIININHENENSIGDDSGQMRSAQTDWFEDWLINRYGTEYMGNLIGFQTGNGLTMYLKDGYQVNAYKDTTYTLLQTLSVVSFVTGVLFFPVTHPVIGVLNLIASAGGFFLSGGKVTVYTLRVLRIRYATCVSGSGYPYGRAFMYQFLDGYYYDITDGYNVDLDSLTYEYVPSYDGYWIMQNVYDAAFDEYTQIGFQPGNF